MHCHRRRYPAKSTLIYAGDKSDSLYFIIKGSVTVIIEDDEGREMIVAYLNDGDFFGEMALLHDDVRTATVTSVSPCTFYVLDNKDVQEVMEQYPAIRVALERADQARRMEQLSRSNTS